MALPEVLVTFSPGHTASGSVHLLLSSPLWQESEDFDICNSMDVGQTSEALLIQGELLIFGSI